MAEERDVSGVLPNLLCCAAAAASVAGTKHDSLDKNCEDAWAIANLCELKNKSEIIALCVCDGAGSAKYGGVGARIASKIIAEYLVAHFAAILCNPQPHKHTIVCDVKRSLEEEASLTDSKLGSYATTAVAVACSTDGRWIAAHLGDGAIAAKIDGKVSCLSYPMKGEYTNQTFFITDKNAGENLELITFNEESNSATPFGFILFSDGVERLLIDFKTGAIAPAASDMMDWLLKFPDADVSVALESQLNEIFKPNSSDDCTIGLIAVIMSRSCEVFRPRKAWNGPDISENEVELPEASAFNAVAIVEPAQCPINSEISDAHGDDLAQLSISEAKQSEGEQCPCEKNEWNGAAPSENRDELAEPLAINDIVINHPDQCSNDSGISDDHKDYSAETRLPEVTKPESEQRHCKKAEDPTRVSTASWNVLFLVLGFIWGYLFVTTVRQCIDDCKEMFRNTF